jgi:hypothetical protein
MHKHFLLSVLLLSLCLGCGTGEYESRIGKHGGGSTAAANLLGPAEEIPGTRVSFRPPLGMKLLPKNTDPRRAVPFSPGMRIYEGFVKDSTGGEIPFYCYFGADKTSKAPGQDVTTLWNAVLKAARGQAKPLTDITVTGADGKEDTWQMGRVIGHNQETYYRDKSGSGTYRPMDIALEFYVHEQAGFTAVITWRVPTNIEKNVGDVGLAELAKAVAGGVTVRPK